MALIPYPADLSSEALATVIGIVGGGDILNRRSELALALWNIIGWGSSRVFGDPGAPHLIRAERGSPDHLTDEQAVQQLTQLQSLPAGELKGAGILDMIDWVSLLEWALTLLLRTLLP